MKKRSCILGLLYIGASFMTLLPAGVQAQTASPSVTVSVQASCVGTIDGAAGGGVTIDVPPSGSVTVSVTNNDNVTVQNITGTGVAAGTQVLANTKDTKNQASFTLTSVSMPTTITFTPVPSNYNNPVEYTNFCPTGSTPTATTLTLNPASASLSCLLSGGTWTLSGTFTGNTTGAGIYSGSNLLKSITAAGAFSATAPASATAQAYTLIDGTTGGKGTLLANATCPKYVPAPAQTSTPTPTPTPTDVIPDPAAGANPTLTPMNTEDTTLAPTTTAKPATPAPKRATHTILYIVLAVCLLAFVTLGILVYKKIIKLPERLNEPFRRIARKVYRRTK